MFSRGENAEALTNSMRKPVRSRSKRVHAVTCIMHVYHEPQGLITMFILIACGVVWVTAMLCCLTFNPSSEWNDSTPASEWITTATENGRPTSAGGPH